MKKYQVEKVKNGKSAYIADIIEAESEIEAIKKYIGKIISYWGNCVYTKKDFVAKEL
ncbi:MAG: hypothetical protein HFH48_02990 [Lachnospiraceae bacterium]|nr:hypothetical protein [Lachnospiraceae bacterium]